MTGLPPPTLPTRVCSFVIVCCGLVASDEPIRASPFKSDSPTALLVEARDTAAFIEDRAERSAALHPIVLTQIAIDPAGARDTLKAFPRLPNKLNYLTALAAAYAATANIVETERIYSEIVVEDQSSRNGKLAAADALGQLAIAYTNKGNLEEAFRTLDRLKERTKQESVAVVGLVTGTLAEAQAKHGDVAGAVQTALSIAGETPGPLMNIVADRVRNGKAEEAQDIVAGLDDRFQRYAQWGIMRAQIELGRLIDAQVTATAIKPGHAKASALLELASYHRQHGGRPLALTLLKEAETSARSTVNDWLRAEILSLVAAETTMAGDADRALSIVKSIEKEEQHRFALREIAKAQAKQGEFAGAFNTADLLKQPSPTDQMYDIAISDVLVEMVKSGKGSEAKDAAATFQDSAIARARLFGAITTAYADLGKLKEAKATLALAETNAQRSARRQEMKHADEARLRELSKLAIEIEQGLAAISKALARKGDLNGATVVADELELRPLKLELIKEAATLHVQTGRKEHTLRWARKLSNPSEKAFALVGIATALSKETDGRKAKDPSAQESGRKR